MSHALERLRMLGLALPVGVTAAARYVPALRTGDLLHLSGQIPRSDGAVIVTGAVGGTGGDGVGIEQARHGARLCALRLLAVAQEELGSLEHIRQVASLTVYVRAAAGFEALSVVADGASELLEAVLGHAGRHARTAVGVAQLPAGASVEISAVLQVHPPRAT